MKALRHVVDHLRTLLGAETATVSDRELLRRFATRRDEVAFAVLVHRHADLVWGVCRRSLASTEDAEDAFQATFLVLARKADSRWNESIRGWLHETAFRISRQARRRSLRRKHAPLPIEPACAPVEPDWREVGVLLDEELARLPTHYREVVVLCCLEGKTRDEAAELLGCSLGRVKGLLERGRETLRQRLTKRGVALSVALLGGVGLGGELRAAPSLLMSGTARAGVQFAAGQTVAVPAAVLALTAEALRPIVPPTFKAAVAAAMILSVVVATVGRTRPTATTTEPTVAASTQQSSDDLSNEEMNAMNQWAVTLGVLSALTGALAADEGAPQVRGVVSAVDAQKRTITLSIRKDGDAEARQETFQISRDAQILVGEGRATKLEEIRAGQQAHLRLDEDGKAVVHVRLQPARKPPMVRGNIKSIDAGKGTLVVTVPRDGGRFTDETVTLGKETQVLLQKKPAKVGDLKQGQRVIVELTPDQKQVVLVQAFAADGEGAKDPPRERERPRGNEVTIKAIDPAKGTITVLAPRGERAAQETTYTLAKDVKMLVDGKQANPGEIQVGDSVTLTLSADGKTVTEIKGQPRKGDGD